MAANATRWGILGAGKIAHDFVVALKTLPESEHMIVAVAARSLERAAEFADRHNIEKAYGSYEELARDANVEVVYISTIHPQHAPHCKLVLSHGKHVLCEKPMTMNLKQTTEVFELAKAKGLFIMEVRSSSRAVDSKSKCDSVFGGIGQKVIIVIIEMKAFGATLSLNIIHSDVPVGEGQGYPMKF